MSQIELKACRTKCMQFSPSQLIKNSAEADRQHEESINGILIIFAPYAKLFNFLSLRLQMWKLSCLSGCKVNLSWLNGCLGYFNCSRGNVYWVERHSDNICKAFNRRRFEFANYGRSFFSGLNLLSEICWKSRSNLNRSLSSDSIFADVHVCISLNLHRI